MARGYSRHKGLGNRCEVKAYIPPKRLIDIAAERTQGLVTYYLFAGRDSMQHLETLARSCYMQGVHDTIDATVQSGKFIAKEEL